LHKPNDRIITLSKILKGAMKLHKSRIRWREYKPKRVQGLTVNNKMKNIHEE